MVDDARMGGLPQDGLLECGVVTGLGNAVEDGTEKYVVALGLALCYLCKTVARSGKAAVEGGGGLGIATVEVNAVEGKLFDKVEMVVEHDATKPLSRNGGKKLSDGVCRGGGLAHMEQVDTAPGRKSGEVMTIHFIGCRMKMDGYFLSFSMIWSATRFPDISMPPKMGPMRGVPATADDAMPQT